MSLSPFKRAYFAVSCIIGIPLFILFFTLCFHILMIDWNELGKLDSTVRNLAIAFVGTISGFGALFGVYLAILRSEENKRQNDTAEEGLITDRINKAVEGLGKNNRESKPTREVRLGALYALERIAQDSIRDHIRIMQIICGYVRVNRLLWEKKVKETDKEPIKEDIRTAITIIAKRGSWTTDKNHLETEKDRGYRIDLRYCNLHNLELYDAELSRALLTGAILRNAILPRAKFKSANLVDANLTNAIIRDADLENASTRKAFAHYGDFSHCRNFTKRQLSQMFLGIDVNIPKGWKHPQEETDYYKDYDTFDEFYDAYREWRKTQP